VRSRLIRPAAEGRSASRNAFDERGRYLGIPRNGTFSGLTSVQGTGCGTPEADAYTILREVLYNLGRAERALTIVQQAGPDDERARHLAAIRTVREQLERFL
jgi:hypothetical protein